jgi:membrane-associated phospholipid phosphatase
VRHSEAVAIAYFLYLAAAALVRPLSRGRRLRVLAASAAAIGAVQLVVRLPSGAAWLRDWFPAFLILLGYFATGAFYVAPSPRFEAWLKRWDALFGGGLRAERLPRFVRVYLDVVYDVTFLLVPAGYGALAWMGHVALADHYWTIVMVAEFIAFGTLPWLQARPPWVLERRQDTDRTPVRRFSLFWVNYTSIRANTFPSGHASAVAAAALAIWAAAPATGAVFAALAISVAVGSVVGRFHYAIDAVTGILLALVVYGALALIGI